MLAKNGDRVQNGANLIACRFVDCGIMATTKPGIFIIIEAHFDDENSTEGRGCRPQT